MVMLNSWNSRYGNLKINKFNIVVTFKMNLYYNFFILMRSILIELYGNAEIPKLHLNIDRVDVTYDYCGKGTTHTSGGLRSLTKG